MKYLKLYENYNLIGDEIYKKIELSDVTSYLTTNKVYEISDKEESYIKGIFKKLLKKYPELELKIHSEKNQKTEFQYYNMSFIMHNIEYSLNFIKGDDYYWMSNLSLGSMHKHWIFDSIDVIEEWLNDKFDYLPCDVLGVENYTYANGVVDVEGDVDIIRSNLEYIPIKFGKVSGDFYCRNNMLTTLKGCPEYVGGRFDCYNNELTNLEGSPRYVGGDFGCANSNLTSLKGCPDKVGGSFRCENNKIETFDDLSTEIGGDLICFANKTSRYDKKLNVKGQILGIIP